jgi:signal transduction histidine kinase
VKPGPSGVAITVTDNGPGIPRDVRRKIFDPFFTTKAHGTGLGLPITKKHIEAHGGRLRVRSAPGRRTTFEILLPLSLVSASEPAR